MKRYSMMRGAPALLFGLILGLVAVVDARAQAITPASGAGVANPITYTGDPTGLNIAISTFGLNYNGVFYSGIRAADSTTAANGLLTINYGNSVMVSLPTTASALTSISAPSAVVSDGLAGTYASLTTLSFPVLALDTGAMNFTANSLVTADFPDLATVGGTITVASTSLTTLQFPSLTAAHGITLNTAALTTLDLSALVTMADFQGAMTSLTTLNLTALTTGDFGFKAPALTTFSVSLLQKDAGLGWAFYAPLLTSLSFPALQHLDGFWGDSGQGPGADFAAVTSISMPAIITILQGIDLTGAASCTTFTLGSTLKSVGAGGAANFIFTGAALTQASVDSILARLAALDGTGGTTSFHNATVNLSGGTSATPSAAGLTSKATLVGRGNTVTTN